MSWRLAKSLVRLREQINAAYPNRDKSSDGSIGDTAHSNRKSDHNPNSQGVVTAIDIDRELEKDGSVTVEKLVVALQASRDPRLKYLIWNDAITDKNDITKWKPYHGANAHRHHVHISVSSDRGLYDDGTDWDLSDFSGSTFAESHQLERDLKFGDTGSGVRVLQVKLGIKVDGDFGKGTKAAVMEFQKANGLTVDGVCGENTRRKLGL